MDTPNLKTLATFDLDTLPDLDTCVLGALELFAGTKPPAFGLTQLSRPLVVGSGNAAVTGYMLFEERNAVFADEGNYIRQLDTHPDIDGAVLISASGSKHAIPLAQALKERNIETWLITNNPEAPAKASVAEDRILVFPKNREPYTYNTSTYMGMLLAKTQEDPAALLAFLQREVSASLPHNLTAFDAFFLLVPAQFIAMRDMLLTKFDELFGPKVSGRVFTAEQSKHAKTVVPSPQELFISFGEENTLFGDPARRLHIPLPADANYAAMMAVGYYVIGHIQKQHPPYFKDNIVRYTEEASRLFGQEIKPIVA